VSKIRPFSNGSQYADWTERNCVRCGKWDPDKAGDCEIDLALGLGYLGDGLISAEIADRMGLLENRRSYTWDCPEIQKGDG